MQKGQRNILIELSEIDIGYGNVCDCLDPNFMARIKDFKHMIDVVLPRRLRKRIDSRHADAQQDVVLLKTL